jgi:hypothetical protein
MPQQAAWQVEHQPLQEMECKINNSMKLFEMYDAPVQGYQDVESDNSKPKWKESRKTKLTLRQIRKLRKMMDVRNFERQKHLKKVHEQYGAVPADAATPTA